VASPVLVSLCLPVFLIGLGNPAAGFAAVAMPKTSMNKYDRAIFWQNDIGAPGQIVDVKTETVSQSVQDRTDGALRRRVP
jgi:hypothetical protein